MKNKNIFFETLKPFQLKILGQQLSNQQMVARFDWTFLDIWNVFKKQKRAGMTIKIENSRQIEYFEQTAIQIQKF